MLSLKKQKSGLKRQQTEPELKVEPQKHKHFKNPIELDSIKENSVLDEEEFSVARRKK